MYTLTVDDNNLYIPEERDYSLNSAKIKINSDRVAYLDFEIPITNKAYGLLNEKTSMVKVYKDNVLTYKFFIDTIEDDFYYNKSVSCTSVVEYLSDSMVRPYSTIESEPGLLAPSSLDGYFQWLIDQHNAVCDTKKKFYVGVNQGASLDNNNYIYRASTQTPTVSSEIKDKILTPYPSAYITVSFDGEKNIINLYSDIYDKNDQLIDFGVNLLDFVKTADYSKCYTAVRPTGSTPEESEGNSSKLPITIESIPDGVSKWSSDVYKKQDVVYSISAVNKFGYKECSYSNSDIKTVDFLYQASVAYLNKISSPALTIEVKAIDLSLLMGDKYSPLKVGQAVRIRSTPHSIDTYMTVSSIDIDVLDPTNDLYTLGESYDSLTGQQSAYVTRLNASINSAVDVIGSASDAASKLAEAASKKAQEAKDQADTATDTASDAVAKADTATDMANSAVSKAEVATTKATDASAKASEATTKADDAVAKATEATTKANLVENKAEEAKNAADSAKQAADEASAAAGNAQTSADNANQAATEAKNSADEANTAASNAQSTADSALSSAAQANKDVSGVKTQITEINKEITSVKQDASTLRDDLTSQITTVKETMEADYTKKSELSATETNLMTEITKSAAGLRTEVSQTYSTKKELETTTKAAQTAQSTADAAKKAAESNASDLANAVSKFDGDIADLKDQIDGAIQTWFYDGIPNALTEPEVNWTTDKDRQTHLGDLYYDNQTGFCYRYMNQNGVYSWGRIQDTEVTKALSDAANAQNTANAKKRIFVTTPMPPYDIGDLWVQGSTGDILRCQTPKIASQTYAEADWVKASKYTDDTAVTNLSNTVEKTYATKSTVSQLSDRIEQTVSSVEEVRTDASAANTAAANAKKAADNAASAAATAQSTASAAQTKATAAASAAATAQTAADEAKENATNAANAAAAAQSKANAAQTAADAAKANASAAQTAADAANADLVTAKQNLQDLQGRADATDSEIAAAKTAVSKAQTAADAANSAASKANAAAATAQSTADTAKANAATAQTKANEAATAANTAQSTADTAKQNAATAQSKANEAASAASTAQSTADTAKANAKKAQDDVNALKNRVTSAETKITQNSEAIALRATKTEVTSAIDNVQVGGRNLLTNDIAKRFVGASSTISYDQDSHTYTVVTNSTADTSWGNGIKNNTTDIRIPYGKTLCISFEIFTDTSAEWRVDINTYAWNADNWNGNDNDERSISGAWTNGIKGFGPVLTNQWIKCWFIYSNTSRDNTGKVDLYDGSNWGLAIADHTYKIRRVKYEYGNKPTDWSPAPEDYSTTTEMQSSINQTAESIKSTVAATYVNNEAMSSYATKSQLEQTSTSLTSRIQTTETTVSGMSTTVKNVNDYMTFARENNQPTLTIGSSSSSFRTKLTNTGEKFMQGDQTIMELDGITSTVKASRVQMGHYQWRDTGTSMQLIYIS